MPSIGIGISVGSNVMMGGGPPVLPTVGTLQLRLRGDLGWVRNGNDLQSIADQSGNGRNYQQLTASKQPLHNGALINGKQAIGDFNGSSDGLVQAAGAAITETTFTVLSVVQPDSTTATKTVISYEVGRSDFIYSATGTPMNKTAYWDGGGTIFGDEVAISGAQYLTWHINGASSLIRRNGTQLGATFSPAANQMGSSSGVGARYDAGSSFFAGKIGEVLVYAPALGAADYAAVESYLSKYWGI